MADPRIRSALHGVDLPEGPEFSVQENGIATRLVLRGREAARAGASEALGLALPEKPCTLAHRSELAALSLGPDEWLLLAPAPDGPALQQSLSAALAGLPHSVVDISHRETEFVVRGQLRARVLNAGCPLDLAEDAFPVGMCTRTLVAKAQVVLWRDDRESFRLLTGRSFARYVYALFTEAARGWEAGAQRAGAAKRA
jgi:sarcosine oxidase subunit gamma